VLVTAGLGRWRAKALTLGSSRSELAIGGGWPWRLRAQHWACHQPEVEAMQIQYLEIVTKDVDAVCAAYRKLHGVEFGGPDAGLGNARTARLEEGGLVGVRAPLRETEAPVVRPYWLVHDLEAAVAAVVEAGGEVAVPPMELPWHGTCAIYLLGGNDHGLWQL
jgi:uncharacterized protein